MEDFVRILLWDWLHSIEEVKIAGRTTPERIWLQALKCLKTSLNIDVH